MSNRKREIDPTKPIHDLRRDIELLNRSINSVLNKVSPALTKAFNLSGLEDQKSWMDSLQGDDLKDFAYILQFYGFFRKGEVAEATGEEIA